MALNQVQPAIFELHNKRRDRPVGALEGQLSNTAYEPQITLPLMRDSEHVVDLVPKDYLDKGRILNKKLSALRPENN